MYTPKKNKELCIQYTIIFVQKRKIRKKHFSVSSLLYRHEKIKMEIKIENY